MEGGMLLGASCGAGFACAFFAASAAWRSVEHAWTASSGACRCRRRGFGRYAREADASCAVLRAQRHLAIRGPGQGGGCKPPHPPFGRRRRGPAEKEGVGCVVRKRDFLDAVGMLRRLFCGRRRVQGADCSGLLSRMPGHGGVHSYIEGACEGKGAFEGPGSRRPSMLGGVPACGAFPSSGVF